MSTFDVIMNNCPFLKKVIEDKINEEVQPLKNEINTLKISLYKASVLPAPEDENPIK